MPCWYVRLALVYGSCQAFWECGGEVDELDHLWELIQEITAVDCLQGLRLEVGLGHLQSRFHVFEGPQPNNFFHFAFFAGDSHHCSWIRPP